MLAIAETLQRARAARSWQESVRCEQQALALSPPSGRCSRAQRHHHVCGRLCTWLANTVPHTHEHGVGVCAFWQSVSTAGSDQVQPKRLSSDCRADQISFFIAKSDFLGHQVSCEFVPLFEKFRPGPPCRKSRPHGSRDARDRHFSNRTRAEKMCAPLRAPVI